MAQGAELSPTGEPPSQTEAPDLSALPPQLRELINHANLPPEFLSITLAAFAKQTSYSGPLPPPEQLAGYEGVLAGAADRILTMAEKQSDHRQHIEKVAVEGGNRRSWWGLWLGFAISLVVLGLSAGAIYTGHEAVGATGMSIDVVALSGVFVYGRREQRKERVEKESSSHLPAPNSN